jgi:hypothetical protein
MTVIFCSLVFGVLTYAALVLALFAIAQLSKKLVADNVTFTGYKQPRADRFRVGDLWTGPEGRTYKVRKGFGEKLVSLYPLTHNIPIHLKEDSIKHFRRIKWGGQP